MGTESPTATAAADISALLPSLVRGERGRALRVQLAAGHPECSADEIEDAVQYACKCFLDEAEGISSPGRVYSWIRVAAHHRLLREAERHRHELAVDPAEDGLVTAIAADAPDPAEELIANEDDADLAMLVEEVASALPERRRDVLALHGAGYNRPQIASRLGIPERTVKMDLLLKMEEARAAIARLCGGGCERGEPLVIRLACGLATQTESAQARGHVERCDRCGLFWERLDAWREKAGALVPVPAAEGASPGVLERFGQKSADALGSLKQSVLGSGAQVKQQATAGYYRSVDPSSLVGVRPGAVAAVVAGCLAIGSGAGYCVEHGVDPIGAARALIASGPGAEREPPQEPTQSAASPSSSESPSYEPAPEPEPAPEAETPSAEHAASSSEPTPPPEQSFEPASPSYPATEAAEASGAIEESTPKATFGSSMRKTIACRSSARVANSSNRSAQKAQATDNSGVRNRLLSPPMATSGSPTPKTIGSSSSPKQGRS